MDKTLAKKTDNILFVKIENDGFDLGAQRREIQDSDLPQALIRDYILDAGKHKTTYCKVKKLIILLGSVVVNI